MNCNDVERALSEPSPLPLQAEEHVRSCHRCQQLVNALNMPVLTDSPLPGTLHQIAERIATNLRPVGPMASARYFLGAFVVIFASIAALGVYRLGAFGIAVMTPLQSAAILSMLAISIGLLDYSLVNQMVPGSRHRIPPPLVALGIMIALTVAITVLFSFQREEDFWVNAWGCIRVGIPIGGLAAVLFWLVLRRGAILSPRVTGAATGLLAGLVGMSVLEIHCPNLDGWHILVSHLGVAIVSALAGVVMALTAEMIGRHRIYGND